MQLHGISKELDSYNITLLFITSSYYFGNNGTSTMYTDVNIMNKFLIKAGITHLLAELAGFKGEIWLGETADAFGGGVNGISDSYLAGFL